MKPYSLYEVETFNYRHITTVSARSSDEAHRKAWKKIYIKNPKLVPYFKENGFVCIHRGSEYGMWGSANLG
jgi:hypothetical protein